MPALPYTKLIHEKLSTILTFAYSLGPIESMLDSRFSGEWKYLNKTVYVIGREKATQACIELAAFLRLLDGAEELSNWERARGGQLFGCVIKQDGTSEPLYLRDMTNKIVHAKDWEWHVSIPDKPLLICKSDEPARWLKAEVEIEALAAFCARLMH